MYIVSERKREIETDKCIQKYIIIKMYSSNTGCKSYKVTCMR